MADSSQSRIGRVRPPRVQITYDVEDGGSTASRELPLVAGVVSDLSGDSVDPVEYAQRQFVNLDPEGVGALMKRIGPMVEMSVSDKISGEEDKEFKVNLEFESMDDFSPLGVATKVPQTAKLLEIRSRLADLYGKLEANDKLDGILGEVLGNEEMMTQLCSELGLDDDSRTESE